MPRGRKPAVAGALPALKAEELKKLLAAAKEEGHDIKEVAETSVRMTGARLDKPVHTVVYDGFRRKKIITDAKTGAFKWSAPRKGRYKFKMEV